MMNRWFLQALWALLFLSFTACVSTGSVAVQEPLTKPFMVDRAAVVVAPGTANAEAIKAIFEVQLLDAKVVEKLADDGARIELAVASLDEGSKAARTFRMGGEAEIVVDVVVKDAAGNVLSRVAVTGNSARKSEVMVAGVSEAVADNLVNRAIKAAAAELVVYLQKPAGAGD
ncbi:MAG: hypothetical protein AAGN82_12535 [Myxococcota bacterium]